MNDENYRVHVLTGNHSLFFKNRQVRTPAEFSNITKQELRLLESQIKKHDLKYTIALQQQDEDEIIEPSTSFIIEKDKEVVIDHLHVEERKNQSILDQLINDEK